MNSAVLILMMDRNELIIDVSGAWVRQVSPMLTTSHLFSPEHRGSLTYKHDSDATGNSDNSQIVEPPR